MSGHSTTWGHSDVLARDTSGSCLGPEFMIMHKQGSVSTSMASITTREYSWSRQPLGTMWISRGGRTGHAHHWLQSSGERVAPLTQSSSWENKLCAWPEQNSRTGPDGQDIGESAQGCKSRDSWPNPWQAVALGIVDLTLGLSTKWGWPWGQGAGE